MFHRHLPGNIAFPLHASPSFPATQRRFGNSRTLGSGNLRTAAGAPVVAPGDPRAVWSPISESVDAQHAAGILTGSPSRRGSHLPPSPAGQHPSTRRRSGTSRSMKRPSTSSAPPGTIHEDSAVGVGSNTQAGAAPGSGLATPLTGSMPVQDGGVPGSLGSRDMGDYELGSPSVRSERRASMRSASSEPSTRRRVASPLGLVGGAAFRLKAEGTGWKPGDVSHALRGCADLPLESARCSGGVPYVPKPEAVAKRSQ